MAEFKGKDVSWKQLWQLISGIHYETPCNLVADKLNEVADELRDGILSKTPDTAIAKVIKDKATLLKFSTSLENYLDLKPVQASNLICSYLVNEYKGSATSLLNLLATDQQKQKLLADIGKYFALERLVLLKVVRNILELHTSKNHPYSAEYAAVLQQLKLPVLLRSYIAQLGHLIREPVPSQQPHTVSDFSGYGTARLVAWAERKNHEIVEVLQILLLLVEHAGVEAAQLEELFKLFRLHSFGRQQHHLDANNAKHVDLVNKVIYSEVALFMKCCADANDATARADTFVVDAIRLLQKQVASLTQHAEHGPILLTWMLFTFQTAAVDTDDDSQLRNRQYGSRAIQLGVFEFLHTMIGHAMYTDGSVTARLVRRTVYAHLTDLCNLFDGDGSVAGHHKIYELLSELLRTPVLAKDFCNREDGVRSLYNTALENFPLDFVALSGLAEAIASTGAQQQAFIRKQLENLPIYTELLKPASSFHLKPLADGENEFQLLSKCTPFAKIDFDIPAGTTAIVQDKPFGSTIHFRTTVNYFNVLHNEINELLAETLRYTADIDAVRERRVCAGIKYLANAVRNVTDPLRGISSEMVHPTEMVFDILTKFKAVQQPPIELLAKCLAVCGNLVPLFDEEIVRRVVNLNVLPYVTQNGGGTGDYRSVAGGAGFESGLVGYYLINFEKNCGRYDFLLTYLEFLHVYAKNSPSQSNDIELPGLVFILREVLPHMHGWHFEKETVRQEIYTHIFKYLLNVLEASDDDGVARVTLRNVCVDSLLNLDNGMVLLRFIAIGNDHLQSVMQNVSNWMTAAETGLNQLVQLAMTTLMQILRLRNKIPHEQTDQLSPLESIIYTQPKQRDTLRIIPVVTSYMSNIFNRRLPLLACRLLRRFAIEFQMSLLACLDMEPDQIRLTFLARLPDDLESDQLKMAVIEFVEACINKQPGLTEAFFRIRNERRYTDKGPRPKEIGDGILTYMTQYLNAVSADPQRIASPLLSKILALFHALWKNNMQSLVQDLKTTTAEGDFWTALCKPLFVDIQPGIPAYSQLFNMLGIELFRATSAAQMDASLETVFKRLLAPQSLNKWVDSILTLPKDTITDQVANETPEWLCRLQSFKDLIVLAIRRRKGDKAPECVEIPAESLKYFADKCLTVLVERSEYTEDVRPFIILAELYLMLMLNCDGKYTDTPEEDDRMLQNITKLLNQTAISYREIHGRARESILAIALHAVVLLAKDMGRKPDVAVDFMRSVVEVLCFELQHTENQIIGYRQTPDEDAAIAANAHQSFILGLNLLKQISASVAANEPFVAHWKGEILSNRILNRLLSCLNAALPVHRFRRIVIEMLDVLIQLAQSACSAELLHSDIVNYLWMRLLPPKEMLQIFGASTAQSDRGQLGSSLSGGFNLSSSFAGGAGGHSGLGADQSTTSIGGGGSGGPNAAGSMQQRWQTNDWWPIYARGIQLVTVLLQQHEHIFLKDALLFVGVHEEYVVDAVLLAKHTMDADAVVLIKTALLLVCELVQYEKQWRLEHASSMINLMRSVQSIMDHSVSLLYRPNILQQLMEKTTVTPTTRSGLHLFGINNAAQPTPELITAMNDLIDVVTICCRSLLNFSPKLLDMLVEPQFVPSQWQPLVEIQFGAPKLYVSHASPQLSFGTVLSAATIFVKSLNLQSYTFHDTPINKLTIRPLCEADSSDDTIEEPDMLDSVDQSIAQNDTTSATLFNMSSTRSMLTKSLSMTSNASSATTAVAAPSNETLSNLDPAKCLRALEFVLTVLCSQSLLALKDVGLSVREKQLIKRELSTELAVFHDFVRKRIMCDARGPLHRKKRGVALIRAADGSFEAIKQQPSSSSTASSATATGSTSGAGGVDRNAARHRPSMREKVMRQQHQLTAAASVAGPSQTPNVGSGGGGTLKRAPIDLSPIVSDTPSAPAKKSGRDTTATAASSTPIVSILSSGGAAGGKRVTFPTNPVTRSQEKFGGERSEDTVDQPLAGAGAYDETVFISGEDSTFTGLSMVQLVEADYLHLLSLVFMHICQHD